MKWYPVIQRDIGLLIQSCHAWNQKASSGGSRSNRLICLFVCYFSHQLILQRGHERIPPEKSQKYRGS